MIPRNRWPLALRDFLSEHMTVTVEEVAICALRSPGGYHPDKSALTWIRQALVSLRWRQGKGSTWRRPAKA